MQSTQLAQWVCGYYLDSGVTEWRSDGSEGECGGVVPSSLIPAFGFYFQHVSNLTLIGFVEFFFFRFPAF